MNTIWWLFCAVIVLSSSATASSSNETEVGTTERILSRKRRYLVFPEGSSLSGAVCMTIGVIGNPSDQLLSWAFNYGIAYELPNNVTIFTGTGRDPENALLEKEPAPAAQRRFRRDLYERLESLFTSMGHNGRECIQRALCESNQYFKGRGGTMIEKMVRTIFSLPKGRVFSFENQGIVPYDNAHRTGRSLKVDCKKMYRDCKFSLLDLALGKYSKPKSVKEYQFM